MKKSQLDVYKDAYHNNFKFYDENILTLNWYVRKIIDKVKKIHGKSMLSLGIGHKIVARALMSECASSFDNYTIVEGSAEIIREFVSGVELPSNVHIVNELFEEFDTEDKFDAIELGFVLEHVDDPSAIIKRYLRFLHGKGLLFIAVPNAKSLHRQIGHEAGLLCDLYNLSSADVELGHKKYFDMESMLALIRQAELQVVTVNGILLKPFSTSQLRLLGLSPSVVDALFIVGEKYPEISNALYFEASF